mmetsp:Transcript_24003/g.71387  ORF Transcript_24003/g.71387 Transcript_24003/m.71387 type:complete len:201 (+) Transcript_24003:306-908(+)
MTPPPSPSLGGGVESTSLGAAFESERGSAASAAAAMRPMKAAAAAKTKSAPEGEASAAGRAERPHASAGAHRAGPSILPTPSVSATIPLSSPLRCGSRAHSRLLIETRAVPARSMADVCRPYTREAPRARNHQRSAVAEGEASRQSVRSAAAVQPAVSEACSPRRRTRRPMASDVKTTCTTAPAASEVPSCSSVSASPPA